MRFIITLLRLTYALLATSSFFPPTMAAAINSKTIITPSFNHSVEQSNFTNPGMMPNWAGVEPGASYKCNSMGTGTVTQLKGFYAEFTRKGDMCGGTPAHKCRRVKCEDTSAVYICAFDKHVDVSCKEFMNAMETLFNICCPNSRELSGYYQTKD
ncbi:hypothetical protein QBC38DRAFT_466077 [Podospora fimiseda]|uniref:Secreted protein n=1 Tax=Podospora fimiseda TaxID=252190 RepID=A0AAN7BXP8_9PEZI|nr:hypothetical protein QBC38DRAFT_466077 [Podospora fimiseda]